MNSGEYKVIKFEDMVETVKVKDNNGYSEGWYNDRKPVHGYKLRAKEGTLLEQLEIKAKGKFKLENDSENYVQEARDILNNMIDKYYELEDCKEDEDVANWLYKAVDRRLINLAKASKGGTSYYDREKGEYIINQIEYFGEYYDGSILEGYINNIKESSMNKSKTHFLKWFDDNKHNILTKKQLDYLNNNEVDVKNKNRLHKNIISRVDKAYHDDAINENKRNKINFKIETVKNLMDCCDLECLKDILIEIDEMQEYDFIIEELYSELCLDDCKIFSSILKGDKSIEKSMYYKILNVLINLENKLKKSYNL